MRHRILATFLLAPVLVAALVFGVLTIASAQEEESERSRFVRFVERQISTPDRQIRLGRIEGALSSDVRISSITIADREGVWLTIENARLVWSRTALLRRRLSIELLEADSITVSRPPLPAEGESEPFEPGGFEVPELPVSVRIDRANVPRVDIAEGVIGPAVALGVDGSLSLIGGDLDTDIAVERLDGTGSLTITADFSNETRILNLDLSLSEPENGVIANLLAIENRPALTFTIKGSGPLDDFAADIALIAAGEELVSGTATISQVPGGLRFLADVGGRLEVLVPALYRDLVDRGSRLIIDATRFETGAVSIARADLTSGVAALTVSGELAPGGVPTRLDIAARLGKPDRSPINLPAGGGRATIQAGSLTVALGGAAGETWTAAFDLEGLRTPVFDAERATIRGGGLAASMDDPDARRVTFDVNGSATGLSSDDPDLAEALGEMFELAATGSWTSGQPVEVSRLRLDNGNAVAGFVGTIDSDGADGSYLLQARDIALFSGLLGRDIGGSADLSAEGTIGTGGLFRLTLDGITRNLAIGVDAVDGLLAGETTIAGTVGRTEAGLTFDGFRVENPQLTISADGGFASENVDITARAAIADVGAMTERAAGRVTLEASVTGSPDEPAVSAILRGDDLTLMDKALTGARLGFDGVLAGGDLTGITGRLTAGGSLDGVPLDLSADIASRDDGARVIDDLMLRAAETQASGNLTLRADGLFEGRLQLDSPDLSAIGPLLLTDASGAASATIELTVPATGGQSARISARLDDVRYDQISVGFADVSLEGDDVLGVPKLAGQASASRIRVGDFELRTVDLTATRSGDDTVFDLAAELAAGRLEASGSLAPAPAAGGFDISLETLRLAREGIEARLRAPFEVRLRDGTITITDADLAIGDGDVRVSGTIADTIDLVATVSRLPLSLANAFAPALQATGTLSGTIDASGTAAAPVATFDVSGEGIGAAPLREFGVSGIAFTGSGRYADGTATLQASADIGGGRVAIDGAVGERLDVTATIDRLPLAIVNAARPELGLGGTVSGTVTATGSLADPTAAFDIRGTGITAAQLRDAGLPSLEVTAAGRFADGTAVLSRAEALFGGGRIVLDGSVGRRLDLTATVSALPLSLVNAVEPGLGVGGALTGEARVTGTLASPQATFRVAATGVTAAPLASAGIGGLSVSAAGAFANDTIRLESARAEGSGLVITASGTVPLTGGGLALDISGTAPLALGNRLLAERGAQVAGEVRLDARVTGSLAAPRFAGEVSADGARFADPDTGLSLTGITLRASLDGTRAVIRQLSASLGEGTVTVTGSVGLDGGFPVDLAIALREAQYTDGELLAATLSGDLTLRGPLVGQPLLAGTVRVDRAEITVPNRLPGGPTMLDIAHIKPPPAVLETLRKARVGPYSAAATREASPSGITLDLTIEAPSRIFVRGRGLDAELGGSLRLTGPVSDIRPVGSFDLRRGRLSILGQRITFDRGEVVLLGDLDPYINFVATVRNNNIEVTLTVQGQASDPNVTFTSVPELPQDEVVAQLLFGRSITELSPFQLAQLAAAVAELAGGGGPSILDQLRAGLGFDDIDILTEPGGGTAVQVGRYISDNVYLGVRVGEETTGVTINLDITRNLKVRGEATERASSLGIFYEREY